MRSKIAFTNANRRDEPVGYDHSIKLYPVQYCCVANNDNGPGGRSSRGGQVNYNEDDNDWGISSEDDKLPGYAAKPVAPEEEGDVIESIHDYHRCENTGS